jgi:hypothetical protein
LPIYRQTSIWQRDHGLFFDDENGNFRHPLSLWPVSGKSVARQRGPEVLWAGCCLLGVRPPQVPRGRAVLGPEPPPTLKSLATRGSRVRVPSQTIETPLSYRSANAYGCSMPK